MKVSYKKLWEQMRANKMRKKDLAEAAGLSPYTMTKLNQDKTVSMETMMKFCKIFHCDIGDVMEIIEED